MLSIKLICVGRLKEQFYTDAANEYIKRLSAFCKLEIIEIPEQGAQIATALEKERVKIEAKLPDNAKVIALCIEGREIDSDGLAELLSDFTGHGSSRLCFVIGGSNGLHESVKETADIKLSLSRMTFPHNLARVLLLEQLYRALSINAGGKYHK